MNTKLKFLLPCAGIASAVVSVTSVVAQTAPAPSPHAHGKGIEALDASKDTQISRDEAKGHRFLAKKFDTIDINKDGCLSRDEFKAFRAAHHGQHKQ